MQTPRNPSPDHSVFHEKLTAYALGELGQDESSEMTEQIQSDSAARTWVEEASRLGQALRDGNESLKASPELRGLVAASAKDLKVNGTRQSGHGPLKSPRKFAWQSWVALASLIFLAGSIGFGIFWEGPLTGNRTVAKSDANEEITHAAGSPNLIVDTPKMYSGKSPIRESESNFVGDGRDNGRQLSNSASQTPSDRKQFVELGGSALMRSANKQLDDTEGQDGDSRDGTNTLPVYNSGKVITSLPDPVKQNSTFSEMPNLQMDQNYRAIQERGRNIASKIAIKDYAQYLQPNSEEYRRLPESEFIKPVGSNALSTFSIDVDSASYSNVRRFLSMGQLPPPEAVRLEELVNYFPYELPPPQGDRPLAIQMELATCPWEPRHRLLRVVLKAREINRDQRPASNLVFLIDVSGSMSSDDKLPLLRQALSVLSENLNENDTISIVTYAGEAGVRLPPTNGTNQTAIQQAINSLHSGGSTNGSAGIELAYRLAVEHFVKGGVNRVILATDGDLNVGVTSNDALVEIIKAKAATGVYLTVLGVGTGNYKDAKLEGLADHGNGVFAYLDSIREASRVLVEQMSGTLVTVAKDVKLQIEFNPAEVGAYRLLGYENRALANQDFADDRKDAGDVGAGHTVTAFYEIISPGQSAAQLDQPQPMRYQKSGDVAPQEELIANVELTDSARQGELARVALRFKQPDANQSELLEFIARNEPADFTKASREFRFASSVAGFALLLQQSKYTHSLSLSAVEEMAGEAIGSDRDGRRAEFLDLVRKAKGLIPTHSGSPRVPE